MLIFSEIINAINNKKCLPPPTFINYYSERIIFQIKNELLLYIGSRNPKLQRDGAVLKVGTGMGRFVTSF